MSTAGSASSHLPSTTFCWLPPLNAESRALGERRVYVEALGELGDAAALPAQRDEARARGAARPPARVKFSRTGRLGDDALLLRSSGTRATPAARPLRMRVATPRRRMAPASTGSSPKSARATSVRPEPEARESDDLVLAHVERHVLELAGTADPSSSSTVWPVSSGSSDSRAGGRP